MSSIRTTCKYHTQDAGALCGPTCAQMVLAHPKVANQIFEQDDLDIDIDENTTYSSSWVSDPTALVKTLNRRSGKAFNLQYDSSEADASGKIVSALQRDGVPAIVPVKVNNHWCVVTGVEIDETEDPYVIQGFYINNPIADLPKQHSATDDCGAGDYLGVQDQFVSYYDWTHYWFIGTNGQFISITDPFDPNYKLPKILNPHRARQDVVFPSQIRTILQEEFAFYQLFGKDERIQRMDNKFADPIPVQRLRRAADGRDDYFLTPAIQDGTVLGYATNRHVYGNLLSLYFTSPGKAIPRRTAQDIARELSGAPLDVPEYRKDKQGRLIPGQFTVEDLLVWRPCVESFSPHLPFWRIRANDRSYYWRIDWTRQQLESGRVKVLNRLTRGGLGA